MKTAPIDGRYVMLMTNPKAPLYRCKWTGNYWERYHPKSRVADPIGWIEAVEPPERTIIIAGVEFKLNLQSHLTIGEFVFLPPEVSRLREFLNDE